MQLKAALRSQHLLLVLDNFEHVVATAPSLVELLFDCPRLKLLVTSREVLHVRGERTYVVQPLTLPDQESFPEREMFLRAGAVVLFLERARELIPDIEFTDDDLPLIAEICRRVDSLPLAIELAAARLKLLSLPALLERLEHRLAILTAGPRDLPARQQTLRQAIAWSYELLPNSEQQLFRRLSVFSGGFTLEAVEALSKLLNSSKPVDLLDEVTSLLDKHLLSQEKQEKQEPRLWMLETIREYGLECLASCDELKQTRRAHALYYLHLAEEAEAHLIRAEQVLWFDLLEREQGNLRATLHWSMEQVEQEELEQRGEVALRLTGTLERFWEIRGYVSEGRQWLKRALASYGYISAYIKAKALLSAGRLALDQDDYDQLEVFCKESLRLYQELGDIQGTAHTLTILGLGNLARGNSSIAWSLLEESHVLSQEIGDNVLLAHSLLYLGEVAITQKADTNARSLLEESLATFRRIESKEVMAESLRYLGSVLFTQGEYTEAFALVEESLAICKEMHYKFGTASALKRLSQFALSLEDIIKARSLFEESLAIFRTQGEQRNTSIIRHHLGYIATISGDYLAAQNFFEESLVTFKKINDMNWMTSCLKFLGIIAVQRGEGLWAARLWGAAASLSKTDSPSTFSLTLGQRLYEQDYERMVTTNRTALGKQAFVHAWEEGRKMTPDQAIAAQGRPLISDQPHTKNRRNKHENESPLSPHGLTEREIEVLRLVAQGLTDAQIAETLVISPRTVNAHLRSIYSKLNISSRNAATRYVLDQHLNY
jgi:predicted ATPase/DNA-binding CsgD family transcriptional regulator